MLASEIWNTLSKIDVTPHVQYMASTRNRPAMRYLPWHVAWTIVKKRFPETTYRHAEDIIHEDGTMEVEVHVVFMQNGESHTESCRLGVMDNNFNAIENPNARQINDNRQRALTKALAFAGLGLNLWSDSDVPVGMQGEPVNEEQAAEINELLKEAKADKKKFLKWAAAETVETIASEKYAMAISMLRKKLKEG